MPGEERCGVRNQCRILFPALSPTPSVLPEPPGVCKLRLCLSGEGVPFSSNDEKDVATQEGQSKGRLQRILPSEWAQRSPPRGRPDSQPHREPQPCAKVRPRPWRRWGSGWGADASVQPPGAHTGLGQRGCRSVVCTRWSEASRGDFQGWRGKATADQQKAEVGGPLQGHERPGEKGSTSSTAVFHCTP